MKFSSRNFYNLSIFTRSFSQITTCFLLLLILDFPFLQLQDALAQKANRPVIFDEDEETEEFDDFEAEEPNLAPKAPPGIRNSGLPKSPRGAVHEEFSEGGERDFDEDEFVGGDHGSNKASPPPKDKISFGPVDKQNYYPEICALIFIGLYVINFFIGKRSDERLAQAWLQAYRGLFELQFAAVGLYENQTEGATKTVTGQGVGSGLLKESQSCFKFYASGRRHCHCLLATLELRKRHDLFSLLLAAVDLSTSVDTVTIEIPMNDTDMEPFVFAIVRRKQERKLRKSTKDLENYCGVVKSTRLPSSLCILTDCPELEREFLDDPVVSVLKDKEDLFVSLHFTDQNASPPFYAGGSGNKKMLKFKFNIPSQQNMDDLKPLMKMAIHFIDRVASKRLSAQARTRALQKRKIVADNLFRASHAQRQEALTKRKEELRKKEEENAVELSPEAQKRKEARDYKAALKKKQPRVKILR